jgi:hypothetical protein
MIHTDIDTDTAPRTRTARRFLAAALLAGLALGTAACSDDDETSSSTDTTQAIDDAAADGGGETRPAGASALDAATCDAFVEFGAAFAAAPEDPAELPAFAEQLSATIATLGEGLPEDLAGAVEVLEGATATVAETGDPSGFFGPEGQEALTGIGAAAFEGCEGTQVTVEGRDYAYEGIPEELPAGRVNLQFANVGEEEHELVILGQAEGSDASFEELLEGGDPEALFTQTTFQGVTFGPPRSTTYLAVDLEPGTYLFLCNIPIGGGEDGLPHHTAGMQQIVEVS